MPTQDHDDPHDSMDNVDAAIRMINRAEKQRGRRVPGPDGTYDERSQPRSMMGALLRRVLTVAVVLMVTALVLKFVRGRDDTPKPQPRTLISAPSIPPPSYRAREMYAQRDVRAYTAPSGDSAVVRRIRRGESVLLDDRDSRQWARVYEPDEDFIGFVHVTDNFAPTLPPPADTSKRR